MTAPVYPRLLTRIQGQDIMRTALNIVLFRGDVDIDFDGSGPNEYVDANGKVWRDRYYQPDTTYHFRGRALDSNKVPYAVVPPAVVLGVPGEVFGCLVIVTCKRTGRKVECVCGDMGPTAKVGEISVEAARRLGVDPNPVIGGDDRFDYLYEVHAGVPAVIDGVTYTLQKYRTAKAA